MPRRAKTSHMNIALRKSWTQEEFFEWAQAQDTRYEFDGLQPVAMTGGFNNADAIGVNITLALGPRLRGSGCRPMGPNAGVATIGKAVCYPDAFVTCSKFRGNGKTVPGAVVVFEVVGNTRDAVRRDHFEKVAEYAAVPSIRRYLIVESISIGVTVHERNNGNEPWTTMILKDGAILRMPEIGIEIPVAEIYQDIDFSDEEDAST